VDHQPPLLSPRNAKWLLALLITLVLFVLVQAVRYLWEKNKTADAYLLVPASAVAVAEVPSLTDWWPQADSSFFWQGLQEMPYFQTARQRLEELFAQPGQGPQLAQYLRGKRVYASLHVTGRTELGYLFYVPMPTDEPPPVQPAIDQWVREAGLATETRQYQGQQIQEVTHRASGEVFSYLYYKNYFIASFTPFLLEEVIRGLGALNRENFYSLNRAALDQPAQGDHPQVYVNVRKMPEMVATFSGEALEGLGHLATTFSAEADLRRHHLVMRGELSAGHDDGPAAEWLQVLAGQAPTPYQPLLQWVPEQTALLLRVGFSDGKKLLRDWQAYRTGAGREPASEAAGTLDELYDFSPNDFYANIGGEVALLLMEPVDQGLADRVVLVRLQDPAQAKRQLARLAQKAAAVNQDTVSRETYGRLELLRVEVPELPGKLFGANFGGFARTHASVLGQYLVMGNSPRAVKNWLDQVEAELVWAKSVKVGELLALFGGSSNLMLVANQGRYWQHLQGQLLPARQATAAAHQRQLLRMELFGFQVVQQGGRYQAVLGVSHRRLRPATGRGSSTVSSFSAKLAAPVATRPWVFRSHVDKSWEVLVQDAQNNLALFSPAGKRLWSTPLGGKILGEVYQIDIYNNDKLQFVFCTSGGIYVVDRLGRFVSGFPRAHSWLAPLRQLSVIDYDNSKNYRFAVADQAGNIYLFDKAGTLLAGWAPRPQLDQLAMPPFHIRTGLKDCIVAVQQDGGVYAIRRNGDNYEGFPVKFSESIASPAYLQEGTSLDNTLLQLLTDRGDLVSLNLLGQVTGREQFGPDGTFRLCTDEANRRGWVVARQLDDLLRIYAASGRLLFEKKMANGTPKLVQYFNFGTNLELVAISDPQTKLLQLYYLNGEDLLPQPLPNEQPIYLRYLDAEELFEVYTASGSTVQKWQVARN
jgi:hypothetical protein